MKPWRERVIAAQARGSFTDEDWRDAGPWATCAVGEQHALHPDVVRMDFVTPLGTGPADAQLQVYGARFCAAVGHDRIGQADDLLDLIEDRVAQLKREFHSAHESEVIAMTEKPMPDPEPEEEKPADPQAP